MKSLVAHGHTAVALARSPEAEATVKSLGATPVRGALDDVDALRAAASAADGVIHLGSERGPKGVELERLASAVMLDALGGKPYVHTGGLSTLREITNAIAQGIGKEVREVSLEEATKEMASSRSPSASISSSPLRARGRSWGGLRSTLTRSQR